MQQETLSMQVCPAELPALCLVTHTYAYALVHTVKPSPERAETLEWLIGFHDRCQEKNLLLTQEQVQKQDCITISFPIAELVVLGTALAYYSKLSNLHLAPEYPDLSAKDTLNYARAFCNRFLSRKRHAPFNC